jgi:hypothetical protein
MRGVKDIIEDGTYLSYKSYLGYIKIGDINYGPIVKLRLKMQILNIYNFINSKSKLRIFILEQS